jgi:hypothetical protein
VNRKNMSMDIQTRLKVLKAEQSEKQSGSEFLKLEEGENKVVIDVSKPELTKNKYGRYVYNATINGKVGSITFPPTLELQVLERVAKNQNAMTIVRVGKGQKDTKYSVKS